MKYFETSALLQTWRIPALSDFQMSNPGLYMGLNNLCCVTRHFYCFFSLSHVIFIRILLRHVTFYILCMYLYYIL